MDDIAIERYGLYRATIRIRRGDGWRVKPEAEELDGQRRTFMASWLMEDDDPYPDEWAMTFEDGPAPLGWVASGDLANIAVVGPPLDVRVVVASGIRELRSINPAER